MPDVGPNSHFPVMQWCFMDLVWVLHSPGSGQLFKRLFGRISSDVDRLAYRQYCLYYLHFEQEQIQIILQNAPQSGSTDAKMFSAVAIRHFWVLGNVPSDYFNQFIGKP